MAENNDNRTDFGCTKPAHIEQVIREDGANDTENQVTLSAKNIQKAFVGAELTEESINNVRDFIISRLAGAEYDKNKANSLKWIWDGMKANRENLTQVLDDIFDKLYGQVMVHIKKMIEDGIDVRSKGNELQAAHDFKEKLTANNYEQLILLIDHLFNGGTIEDFPFTESVENMEPDFIDITASRTAQEKNDAQKEYEKYIDFSKIKKYIDNSTEFKHHTDGSVDLPNGTHIPSKRKMNALTKSVCGDKAETYKSYPHFGGKEGDFPSEDISFNNLKGVVKEREGSLEEDGYTAILGGEEELQKKLIEGNFPNDWNEREQKSALLYVAPQLYGVSHINSKKLQVLRLTQDVNGRGVDNGRDENSLYGLIWVRNA